MVVFYWIIINKKYTAHAISTPLLLVFQQGFADDLVPQIQCIWNPKYYTKSILCPEAQPLLISVVYNLCSS